MEILLGEHALVPSRLYTVECKRAEPVYAMLALTIDATGRDAILVDGGNRANPYPLVRICKQLGIDHEYVLDRVHVSRAFTAHQLESIICGGVERMIRLTNASALGVVRPSAMFSDDQLDEYEARCMLGRCLRAVSSLTVEHDLFSMVTDLPLHPHLRRCATLLSFDAEPLFKQSMLDVECDLEVGDVHG